MAGYKTMKQWLQNSQGRWFQPKIPQHQLNVSRFQTFKFLKILPLHTLSQEASQRCTSPEWGSKPSKKIWCSGNKGFNLRVKWCWASDATGAEGLDSNSANYSPNQVPGKKKELSLCETIGNSFQRAFVILWGVWEN